ncbi:hypothetical protein A3C98_02850 [Candidatus Roizmanbacteria bacterium RIFCSPHIGHO2_02_FULL_37_15]|uniref:Lactamase n=1 Tax=Candidatus Roizmanbacteria bacterium RIFCSPLOWO2_01_FULL_37_16 TaxID=1802058 RepID=A0A1F7IKH1_9BACT|nr:MAG: hypothetical protein A2859_01585 [Candidatus Roizmanbacteria bacterium RIFCSPHIGHO2_01_FULL_37_16b]OGK20969.1 MAG: hypothetical protein A3C98_02850 [Candidatus Roizmanbacteria bacterium RIFCSPHIGHO2_02_FULL_37_15]OGK33177.1 MAG: hypothetical protein A3F57_01180 [Candidatus Roizmanbacteria bacterium RIFCSPHIGHO2_12_FULL_36_11]OGK43861.1 MAG: hypothetical protein A3B40_00880 [Candidatus Roizmanbacteria bacterium RIFCSPLOWO2_01_FULL_37_16]OGK56166.1 MAG: hypothetical protein A3I50_04670 [C
MDIKYLGHASFFIKSKEAKLVTDPFDPKMVGLKFPKVEADIVTVSHHHSDHDQTNLINGEPLVIDMPGEYEKKGLRVFGHQSYHDKQKGAERGENIVYKIEGEGVSLLHCGDLGIVLDDAFIDTIGDVDVLLVPVGGFFTIDAVEASELVKKIEPSIVIPMHYNSSKLNQQVFAKLLPVSEFLKKIGQESAVPVSKLTIKKEELEEEMKVVVMEISS